MFTSTGRLRHTEGAGLIVEVCQGLTSYYRSTIPASMPHQKPRWPPHITVVRAGKDKPALEQWGHHEGEIVTFGYEHYLYFENNYYWLNAWCDRLVEIRTALGLPPKSRWTLPPGGGHQCFHITIANTKFIP